MDNLSGMIPYFMIFPESEDGVLGLRLPKKVGKAKAGAYSFVEGYCTERGCDCRRTTVFIIGHKGVPDAVIDFGFDPDEPMSGPFLNDFAKQSAGASDLMQIFVEAINDNPDWLKGMYDRYRKVRKKVDGKSYRGKPFVKPGAVERRVTPPETLTRESQQLLENAERSLPEKMKKKKELRQTKLFADTPQTTEAEQFIENYYRLGRKASLNASNALQDHLRQALLRDAVSGEELATLLRRLITDEARFTAALQLLFEVLEILRVELERNRPGSIARMERWQQALADKIFIEDAEGELCASVTRTLLQSRVEILPLLHEANTRRMFDGGKSLSAEATHSPEESLAELVESMLETGLTSPFELCDVFQELIGVGTAEIQGGMNAAFLSVENPLIRDMAALTLFHPQAEVRTDIAAFLADQDGKMITPETLRRLIVARNWFPEKLRKDLDRAIANARKARIDCAALPRKENLTVYGSAVDGAGAQSLQIIIPEGKGFASCSLLLKQGVGVADAFFIPLESKRALRDFLDTLNKEIGALEISSEYLDQRVCQGLAVGSAAGNVPNHWLVAIAERLGRDQWRAIPFAAKEALAALGRDATLTTGRYSSERAREEALEASEYWLKNERFASSWFEDDASVDRLIEKAMKKRKNQRDPWGVLNVILNDILEPRRQTWLERLIQTTEWLKEGKKPPITWQQMYHVATALADPKVQLDDIPLMVEVAEATLAAHMGRKFGDME